MSSTSAPYRTGLLLGRAYALASAGSDPATAARELCELAEGDRTALQLAQTACGEAVPGHLLNTAIERFDQGCPALS